MAPSPKTLDDANVPQLDQLAAEHAVADYPAGGKKTEKVAALKAALGADFTFAEPDTFVVQLPADADVNAIQFADPSTGVQVELKPGDTHTLFQNAHRAGLLASVPLLEAVE